ncbi:MAG: four helix bundle protein [Chloroflexi bacterium]|nr:four helix bundle protein [Chloroflexota bacterium]
MPIPRSHRDVTVWNWAMDLTALAYKPSEKFPRTEGFRLKSQVTRLRLCEEVEKMLIALRRTLVA